MKRFISIFFTLCLVVALTLSASAESTNKLTYAVGASAPTVSANTEFTILVEVTENTGICWAKTVVTYDSSVLTYVGSSTDTSKFDSKNVTINNPSAGTVNIVVGSMNVFFDTNPTVYKQTGTLAAITFKVNANVSENETTIFVKTSKSDVLVKKGSNVDFDFDVRNASRTLKITDSAHTCTPAAAVKENEIPASCLIEGSYDSVVYCSECKTEISRETVKIPKNNDHKPGSPISENSVAPTCQKAGSYDEVVKCTLCSAEISRTKKETPKSQHAVGESKVENLVDSTCAKVGSYELVTFCSVCSDVITRDKVELPKGAHTPGKTEKENVVEATCNKVGSYTEVVHCSVCDAEMSSTTKELPKTEHVKGETTRENQVAATCIKNGSYDEVVHCAICKAEITRVTVSTDKTDHTMGKPVVENKKNPVNCGADGTYESVVYCSVCKVELSRVTQSIAAPKHTPGPVATATSPQICTVCNKILAPKLDHVHSWSTAWTSDGVGHWHTCSGCDDKNNYEAHHYSNGCDADCNICGATRTVAGHQYDNDCDDICNKCNEKRVIVGHVYDNSCDSTCNTCGVVRIVIHVYDNNCDAECNNCKATRVPADHVYGSWNTVKQPTATTEGQRERSCNICGKKVTESIPATGTPTTTPPETTQKPEVTTTPPETTEEPVVTTEPVETTTESIPGTDATTEAPGTDATEPDATTEPDVQDPGCGSVVSMGIAIIAILGTALIMKKRD